MVKNETVLITGVGGDIGQGIIKCLKETGYNFSLIGTDVELFAAGKSIVDKFYLVPLAKKISEYVKIMRKIISEENVKFILPSTEPEIMLFSEQGKNISGTADVVINHPGIIKTFFDKYETVNFLKKNKLPYPETYLLKDYNGELRFPFLLKPRKGCGGKGLIEINNNDEFSFFGKSKGEYIVQEMIGTVDEEYTAAVFSAAGKTWSIAFKRYLGYGSLTKVAEVVYNESLKALAEKIAAAVSLEGSLNIQCRKKGDIFVPFEINPRLSSTVYTRHCFGFQDVKFWIDLKKGKEIKYIPKFKKGVAVRCISEVFFEQEPY
jgi:carbamoyl-phosphate synthase large subunit